MINANFMQIYTFTNIVNYESRSSIESYFTYQILYYSRHCPLDILSMLFCRKILHCQISNKYLKIHCLPMTFEWTITNTDADFNEYYVIPKFDLSDLLRESCLIGRKKLAARSCKTVGRRENKDKLCGYMDGESQSRVSG